VIRLLFLVALLGATLGGEGPLYARYTLGGFSPVEPKELETLKGGKGPIGYSPCNELRRDFDWISIGEVERLQTS